MPSRKLPEILQRNFEFWGQRGADRERLAGRRVLDREFARMQGEPVDQRLLLVAPLVPALQGGEEQLDFRVPVKGVVEDRDAGGGEVDPDLVRAPRDRPALQEAEL